MEEVARGRPAEDALLGESAAARDERFQGRDHGGKVEQVGAEPGAAAEKHGDSAHEVSTGSGKEDVAERNR